MHGPINVILVESTFMDDVAHRLDARSSVMLKE